MTLQNIGLKHGTDKAATHFYMGNYEKYLSTWGSKEFTLLEIGVGNGSSIKMWREAFPNAKVFGIDINPDCAAEGILIGNQNDKDFMDKSLLYIGSPDVIVDDGSHEGWRTIDTFQYLFPKIKQGGLYFVEDTATFYNNHYSGQFESNGRSKVFNFFTGLAYDVDVAGRGMTGNVEYALAVDNPNFDPIPEYSRIIDSLHIHPSLWLIRRK